MENNTPSLENKREAIQESGISEHPLSRSDAGNSMPPPPFQLKSSSSEEDDVSTEANAIQLQSVNEGSSSEDPNSPVQMKESGVMQLARNVTKGKITYNTQDFNYNGETADRERVSSVVATGANPKDQFPPNEPISFMNNDTGKWDGMDGWHKGHVAARAIGGSYASYNMVPMLPNFNTGGAWGKLEADAKSELSNGETVTITPSYTNTPDERVPTAMTVSSTGGYNQTTPHSVPQRDQTTDEYSDFIDKVAGDKDNHKHAVQILTEAAKNGQVPANFAKSPYFPLDVLWLNGGGKGTPKGFFPFQTWQIDWLIRYNKRLNGGNMESDAWVANTNEPHQVLDEGGRKNRPEADHIIPNSSGGVNFFSNCRLVSWELNNSIERIVSADQKHLKW